jgi:hypothetical protein
LILVDDSAEAVVSVYGKAVDPVWCERLGSGSQGRRGGQGSVGSVAVIMPLEFPKRVAQVCFVPDQRAPLENTSPQVRTAAWDASGIIAS